jgi:hypothetical protein
MSFTNNIIKNNGNGSVWDGFGNDVEWTGNVVSGNGWNNNITSRGFANLKPVAAFTCPTAARQGQAVSFLNTSYDPDGSIGHVLWDFGDGLPSTDFNPVHAYANPGSYTVSLVVWDNAGRGKLVTHILTVCPTCYDLTGDRAVDMLDLGRFAEEWLWTGSLAGASNVADLNCDGFVNMQDMAVIAGHWLQPCL